MNGTAFRSLFRAMFLGFVRDRRALFFTVLFPLFFLLLFGGLFKNQSTSKANVLQVGAVAAIDQAAPAQRAGLDTVLKITQVTDADEAARKVREGDVAAAISQRGDRVVIDYSAADPVKAQLVRNAIQDLAHSGGPPAFQVSARQVEDESLKPIQFYTPGLLGWAIASAAMFGASATLVTWRTKGTLRRIRLAPVATTGVFGARIGVSLGIALVQMALFIGVGTLSFFGLTLSDDWWMAVPLVLCGTLAFLSIGLLIGAWATTQESAQTIAQLIVLPMAFLGGSFFPLDITPGWLQVIANVFPLKHLNEAMLNVMVRGEGPVSVLPQIGILLAFALVASLLAARLFRWEATPN
ncbi:MAG TPA: ABC transporter permease [Streptosporangiaceae bacterium]|nr:ABC transporter permease [Streptosporangiaceae bacterium]